MKKYSYEQLEAMMFKAHEDAQNGLETDLGKQVRESLESQEKEAPAPSMSSGVVNLGSKS